MDRNVKTVRLVSHGPAVGQARLAVRQYLSDTPVVEDAALVVSELVGNAVVHGCGGSVDLTLARCPGRVRIEVADDCESPWEATDLGSGGYGLRIVGSLSDRWGVEPGDRVLVWSELSWERAR